MRDVGRNLKEALECEEEWLKRTMILNEVLVFFMTVSPPLFAAIQTQVDALNEGDCGLW